MSSRYSCESNAPHLNILLNTILVLLSTTHLPELFNRLLIRSGDPKLGIWASEVLSEDHSWAWMWHTSGLRHRACGELQVRLRLLL